MAYDETIRYLYNLQAHGIKLGLENPLRMLALFDDPQASFRSVHVAGTNGKGSTSAVLASVLSCAGRKTGLFTSPHLVSFTERIRVDGVEISEDEVVSLAEEIRERTWAMEPTFFEVVTVMGFLYFMRECVDFAVVETGMGGRLDATNVLAPEVTVITPVDMDHGEFLGGDIRAVAREKAGIIKEGVPVVCAAQKPEVMEIVQAAAASAGSALYVAGIDFLYDVKALSPGSVTFDYRSGGLTLEDLVVPLPGEYQALNASLAIRVFELLSGEDGKREEALREGLSTVRWPGRLEKVAENPVVLLDGAHNPAAARALVRALRETYLREGERLSLVMGVMADKDVVGILRPILPLASEIIFTAPAYGRAARPEELSGIAASLGFQSKTVSTVAEAVSMARKSDATVLVTGSFYTIGEAREALGERGFLTRLREWQWPG